MRNSKPILPVEDARPDVMMFKRVLENLKITKPLIHTINCKEALTWPKDEKNEKPCIVVTDLNTPVMDGLEFLKKDTDRTAITLDTVDNRSVFQIEN